MGKKNKKKKGNSINKNKKIVENNVVSIEANEEAVKETEEVIVKEDIIDNNDYSFKDEVIIEDDKKSVKEIDNTTKKDDIVDNNDDSFEDEIVIENNKKSAKEIDNATKKDDIVDNSDDSFEKEFEEVSKKENVSEATKELKEENSSYTIASPKKSYKSIYIISFILTMLVVLFLIFSTAFALVARNKDTIISGIKIKDISVSGLSKEQAIEKVSNVFKENLEEHITLKHNDYELDVFLGQFDVSFSIEEAVNMAYDKGHMRKYF